MRKPTLGTVQYMPEPVPSDPGALQRYLDTELNKIAGVIALLAAGHIDKTYAPPAKPRDGDIRYVDGTQWNPGSGAGVYYFNGTIWKLLG